MSSDIIKIFYAHDIIPKPSLISIDVDCIRYNFFSFPIDVHKSVAITLLHTI